MSPYTWQEPVFWLTGKFFFSLCPTCDPRVNLLPLDVVIFYLFSRTLFSISCISTIRRTAWLAIFLLALPILSSYQVITGALNIYKQLFGTVFFIMSISAYKNNKLKLSIVFAILASLSHNIFLVFSILLYSSLYVRRRLILGFLPSIIASLACYWLFYFLGVSDQFDIALEGVQSGADSRNILIAMVGLNTALGFLFIRQTSQLFPFFLSLSLLNALLAGSTGFFRESVTERVFLLSILIQSVVMYISYINISSRRIDAFLALLLIEITMLVLPVFISPVIPVLIWGSS